MKYALIAILLLITISGMAQKSKVQEWVDMQVFKKGDTAWVKGDTVEFNINTSVKFIKIGDATYQIVRHNPTIEKYEPPIPVNHTWWQDTIYPIAVPTNAGSPEIKY